MHKGILTVLALMLLIGSVAAFTTSDFERSPAVPTPSLTAEWVDVCAKFTWSGTSDPDLNNYVIQTESNISKFHGIDDNTTANEMTFCTLTAGDYIVATVYRVDGNADGLYLNELPDARYRFDTPGIVDAGMFLFYGALSAVANLIGLIVLITVLVVLLTRTGLKSLIKFR